MKISLKLFIFYFQCILISSVISALFTDNTNGTVTDLATGLIWQKCSGGLTGSSCSTGNAIGYTWANAVSYCNSLSLASRTWRLPNFNELQSILDYTKATAPSLNTTAFPATVASQYWSSTTSALSTPGAWWLSFNNGVVDIQNKTSGGINVRCVSGP